MRAILLAAGMGTRLRPLTLTTPKSLVEVNGKPMLERQIEFLREIDIDEIIVVTGYLNEKFEYLREKYGVKLIHNEKFDIYNNIYTMYLVREYIGDSYVIDADVYLNRNFLERDIEKSTYFSGYKTGFKNEWKLEYDENNKVSNIIVGNGEGYILSGISYWSKSDASIINKELEKYIENGKFKDLYWDDVVKDNLSKLDVYIRKIKSEDSFEVDSLRDLSNLNELLNII
ncbi:lic-1 operon protein [[Clostridium] sordellii]|uniref:CTP:phosphocholine cytidylyltransferase n=1 Tax=Paraclostridium sordellii TaxID=1505 RepID=A0ABP1XWD4_PARSO|nr:sugar phosphate nucleotidyltransferase [Paeniclostridium sordellii]CEJ74623.1 CTP:phosphocholine cytidylyltransferase [[Clostridium] sordellii] [Paeniclostridium sordellii]CEN70197.1 lic-1 operon protein [[Clostridium] sordellii] [Paeniclostridium sordellii]CEN73487.1 lic-1 operon protein [[Clostridium] sordellii] [Paeniclostridium sordellii]CEO27994.1 lic-1 operon protein [[Clostridium] sordellii] [Paeniclostridium sordellii]CEP65535.1 lic-1 operon protein [[Clostridium] sordellii] [Paenic